MSNKQLRLFIIYVQVSCPYCGKPIKFGIKFHGTELNQKKKQTVILDCPRCGNKEVEIRVNIDKKIKELLEITFNYQKNIKGRSITGPIPTYGSKTVVGSKGR